jgi:hypothetical protein
VNLRDDLLVWRPQPLSLGTMVTHIPNHIVPEALIRSLDRSANNSHLAVRAALRWVLRRTISQTRRRVCMRACRQMSKLFCDRGARRRGFDLRTDLRGFGGRTSTGWSMSSPKISRSRFQSLLLLASVSGSNDHAITVNRLIVTLYAWRLQYGMAKGFGGGECDRRIRDVRLIGT